ncbi:metal-dependent hydrolase [uncultured Thiodictyon sp.]|uniref:metal-dependent hydrolase n=1 Tax=uncultured Thiodictyon sp. TaxID=1846217 RepID=UPI0025FE6DC6|nr:metal-dependent hydrolase [uncultured Thiodictyon sp.]
MANFKTHFYVGIFVSGGAVLAVKGLDLVPPGQTLVLFGLGVTGSVLPDIDADISSTGRAFFGALGAALAFGWTLPLVGHYRSLDLAVLWFALFLAVRFLLFETFARFTVHRGIWHSWLAVAFVTLATVHLEQRLLEQPPRAAWVGGLMLGLGYLTHLCLDEVYSVDLFNKRIRRSFGTALKPFSFNDPLSSLAMAAAVGVLAWFAPPAEFSQLPTRVEVVAWADQGLVQLTGWLDVGVAAVRTWLR